MDNRLDVNNKWQVVEKKQKIFYNRWLLLEYFFIKRLNLLNLKDCRFFQ
jgi:hypothetical protein